MQTASKTNPVVVGVNFFLLGLIMHNSADISPLLSKRSNAHKYLKLIIEKALNLSSSLNSDLKL